MFIEVYGSNNNLLAKFNKQAPTSQISKARYHREIQFVTKVQNKDINIMKILLNQDS